MRNDFSHVSSNFAENLMSKHEYACYGNTSCCFLGWQISWNQAHDRNCQGKGHGKFSIEVQKFEGFQAL